MKRILAFTLLSALLFGLLFVAPGSHAANSDKEEIMEGLRELNPFIGKWKGTGGPDKLRPDPGDPIWSEKLDWGWRFKNDDAWLMVKVNKGKFIKSGEMRYLPEKERYQFTANTVDGKKLVFEGRFRGGSITMSRTDPKTKEQQRLRMTIAGDGVRFIYRFHRKPAGTTLWQKDYMVACTKEGESLAAKKEMRICVVTGGLGTSAVSYKGETFYVCCSGCADAFRENPEKYIKEFKAKK